MAEMVHSNGYRHENKKKGIDLTAPFLCELDAAAGKTTKSQAGHAAKSRFLVCFLMQLMSGVYKSRVVSSSATLQCVRSTRNTPPSTA